MAYITKLSKQGNSVGVRIPKEMLDRLGLAQGDSVLIEADDRGVRIQHAESDYTKAMELGKKASVRYRRALAKLAK